MRPVLQRPHPNLPPVQGRRKSSQQRGADGSFIQPGKHHVVPPGQRTAARNQLSVRIQAQRLELPHRANSFEVANALAAPIKDANQLVIHTVQGQWIQGSGSVASCF